MLCLSLVLNLLNICQHAVLSLDIKTSDHRVSSIAMNKPEHFQYLLPTTRGRLCLPSTSSCGKVMFTQASVIVSTGGGAGV